MPKVIFGVSPTSVILRVKLLDGAQTYASGLNGLSFSAVNLTISTIKPNESAAVVYTNAADNIEYIDTLGTYVAPSTNKCRFRAVNPTYNKGVYELQLADARFDSTDSLLISIAGGAEWYTLADADFEVQCKNLAADLKSIDGQLTNANNATLNLKQLIVSNTYGNAVEFTSTGGGGTGLQIMGASDGIGMSITGYGTGAGIQVNGGSNADGVSIYGGLYGNGNGLYIAGTGSGAGIKSEGGESGAGIKSIGGVYGNGVEVIGGATSGNGMLIESPTDGSGLRITASGEYSNGIYAQGGSSAYDLYCATPSSNLPATLAASQPNYAPAKAGDEMTLTSIYNPAMSAASQTSVNALGSPMQAGSYVAPDNVSITAIKAKTDTIPASPAAVGSAMTLTSIYNPAMSAASQTSVNALGSPMQAGSVVNSNLIQIDGLALVSATLNLKQLNIQNATGDAVLFKSTFSGGKGIYIQSTGGIGLHVDAYDNAIRAESSGEHGVYIHGGGSDAGGLVCVGSGGGEGAYFSGGNTGNGLECYSPRTVGFKASSGVDGKGMEIIGSGTGAGIQVTGGATSGDAVSITATAGEGIVIGAAGIGNVGLRVESQNSDAILANGNGNGMRLTGANGSGLSLLKGSGGYDLQLETPSTNMVTGISGTADANLISINGQLTSGNNATLNLKQLNIQNNSGIGMLVQGSGKGMSIVSTGSHGLYIAGATSGTGDGIQVISGTASGSSGIVIDAITDGDGIRVTAQGTNRHALKLNGAGSGSGLLAVGGATGHGFALQGGASGYDLYCATPNSNLPATVSGVVNSNLIQIDGLALVSATLNLKRLIVSNSNGTAVEFTSTGGSGAGLQIMGASNGIGMSIMGNGTGAGIQVTGGSNANGVSIYGGLYGNGDGLYITGTGSGNGISVFGGATGHGISAYTAYSSGAGIRVAGGNTGLNVTGAYAGIYTAGTDATDGDGFYATGTLCGIRAVGSSSSSTAGMTVQSFGNGSGLSIIGNGSGSGIWTVGGITGHGVLTEGGGTSGHGISAKAQGIGDGIVAQGGATSGNGISASGVGTSGSGMLLTRGGASGYDLKGATPSSNLPVTVSGTVTLATSQPNYAPAKAGDEMTLSSAYDQAKTAASQASVNSLGSPMQAGSYVAPDNASITAIKAKTDQLVFIVDGMATSAVMSNLLSMASGKFDKDTPNPGDVTFYKQDNITPAFSMHITSIERTRTYQAP